MAPSSLGEGTGYGIFTVEDIPKGHDVLNFDGPNVPVVIDLDQISKASSEQHSLTLWHSVWWGTHGGMDDRMMNEIPSFLTSSNGSNSSGRIRVFDFQPIFGALTNHHEFLSNLRHRQPHRVYDDSVMQKRSSGDNSGRDNQSSSSYHPGRAAASYYRGKHFMADIDISAGSEIFLSYGRNFLPSRGIDFAHIPRRRDYYTAARLLRKIFIEPSQCYRRHQ
jgi:hypothetical protein